MQTDRPHDPSDSDADPLLSPLDAAQDEWLDLLRGAEQPRPRGRIGPYEILDEVRAGEQGLVFRASQPGTGREVALKRVAAGSLSTNSERRRFEREVEAVASLTHPGIVTVHGVEVVEGVPLLVMEWVEGEPLSRWSARRGKDRSGTLEKLRAFLQVCDAVQHAHQSGVIHRDLKPSNVLVDGEGRCRVLDFGLARTLPEAGVPEATRTLGFVGTPAYAAPERFTNGTTPLDVRSDVYSLGVMLHEMLTGELPFGATSLRDLIEQIERHTAARPSSLTQGADRELDTIVGKAMAKESRDRYQSVHAFGDDVRRYLEGRSVAAMPPSTAYLLRKWIRRNRLVFALSLLVGALAVGSAVLGIWQASVIADERDAARAQAERAEDEARRATALHDFYLDALRRPAAVDQLKQTSVVDVFEHAVKTTRSHFAEHPEIAVEIEGQVASVLTVHGRHDAALELVTRALELSRTLDEPRVSADAELLGTQGLILISKGRYEQALSVFEEALALESPDSGVPYLLALFRRGTAHLNLGRYPEAESDFRACLEDGALGEEERAPIIAGLARVLLFRGKIDEAEPLLLEKLAQVDADPNATPYERLRAASDAGEFYALKGDRERAATYHRRAYELSPEVFPEGSRQIARDTYLLAQALTRTGEFEEAATLFERILEMDCNPVATAHSRRSLAHHFARNGDFEAAVQAFDQSCEEYQAVLPPDDGARMEAFVDRIRALVKLERTDEARALVPEALAEARACAQAGGFARPGMWDLLRQRAQTLGVVDDVDAALAEIVGQLEGSTRPGYQQLVALLAAARESK